MINYIDSSVNVYDVVSGLYLNKRKKSEFSKMKSEKITHPLYLYNNSKDQENITVNESDVLVIAAGGLRDNLAISTDVPCYITVEGPISHGYSAKIVSMQSKLSGFITFSSYYAIAARSPILISLEQIKEIVQREYVYQPNLKKKIENSTLGKLTSDFLKKEPMFSNYLN